MGMEYRIIDRKKKERFDLGKTGFGFSHFLPQSSWIERKPFSMSIIHEKELCRDYVLYELILAHVAGQYDENITLGFLRQLANKILQWCGDSDELELWGDQEWQDCSYREENCSWEELDVKYPETGSVYTFERLE